MERREAKRSEEREKEKGRENEKHIFLNLPVYFTFLMFISMT